MARSLLGSTLYSLATRPEGAVKPHFADAQCGGHLAVGASLAGFPKALGDKVRMLQEASDD